MKNKPSWRFFFSWLIACTVVDLLLQDLWHGHFAWSELPTAIEGAVVGAALTWFFALLFWYKSQDRF
jgi:hypothetical protein